MTTHARRRLTMIGALVALTKAGVALPTTSAIAAPTITAQFSPQTGTLTITGTSADNTVAVADDATGTITVNAGAVPIRGGRPTAANVTILQVRAAAGNDTVVLDESAGGLPSATVSGGDGDDTVDVVGDGTAERYVAVVAGTAGVQVNRAAAYSSSITLAAVETLALNTGAGDDTVSATAAVARRLHLVVTGGAGQDSATLIGSARPDTFTVTPGVDDTFVTVSATDYASLDVESVGVDLSGSGSPDGVADSVTVYGTDGPDDATLTGMHTSLHTAVCGASPGMTKTPFTLTFEKPLPIPVDRYPLVCEPAGNRLCR